MLLSGNPTLIWKLVLGVDANQGWLVSIVDRLPAWNLERATAFAAACFDNQIDWLEEPLDSREKGLKAALDLKKRKESQAA